MKYGSAIGPYLMPIPTYLPTQMIKVDATAKLSSMSLENFGSVPELSQKFDLVGFGQMYLQILTVALVNVKNFFGGNLDFPKSKKMEKVSVVHEHSQKCNTIVFQE